MHASPHSSHFSPSTTFSPQTNLTKHLAVVQLPKSSYGVLGARYLTLTTHFTVKPTMCHFFYSWLCTQGNGSISCFKCTTDLFFALTSNVTPHVADRQAANIHGTTHATNQLYTDILTKKCATIQWWARMYSSFDDWIRDMQFLLNARGIPKSVHNSCVTFER